MVPPEIRKWNWGAFVFTDLWAMNMGNLLSRILLEEGLLLFVFLFANPFYLGARGNEIAWKYQRWPSVEQFLHAQHWWTVATRVVSIAVVVLVTAIALVAFTTR